MRNALSLYQNYLLLNFNSITYTIIQVIWYHVMLMCQTHDLVPSICNTVIAISKWQFALDCSNENSNVFEVEFHWVDSFMETMSLVFIIALLNAGISSSRYLLLQLKNASPGEDRIEKHEFGQKNFNSYGKIISLDLNK